MPLWGEQMRIALRRRAEAGIARRLGVPIAEVRLLPSVAPAARLRGAGRSLPP
ncbi:hypothetical protein T261_0891 [Streptomyces lydicus]|nr:hypothetical protein T261_0891 [Streptomyces lydicus]